MIALSDTEKNHFEIRQPPDLYISSLLNGQHKIVPSGSTSGG